MRNVLGGVVARTADRCSKFGAPELKVDSVMTRFLQESHPAGAIPVTESSLIEESVDRDPCGYGGLFLGKGTSIFSRGVWRGDGTTRGDQSRKVFL